MNSIELPIIKTQGRHGEFHHLATDHPIGECLTAYGEWAEAEVHLFQKVIQPGQTVLEVGANIGTHTVPIAKIVGPQGRVIAYEPVPFNHQILAANLLNNECHNALTFQAAVGENVGLIQFPLGDPTSDNNFGAFGRFSTETTTFSCLLLTIDSLDLPALDFLKVDVEGAECEVITGAMSTIRKYRPTLFVESFNHHSSSRTGGHTQWLIETLKPLGYRFYHFITPLFNPDNWKCREDDMFPGQWSFDLLCVPPERGAVIGLPDAETAPMYNDDPLLWRSVNFKIA